MSTAWERFQSATLALTRAAPIKERLEDAYRNHLAFVLEEELPKELRDDFRAYHLALNRERPATRKEDAVRATIRKLSSADADRMAELIVRLFSAMPRSQPMLVRTSGPAQVIPLYVAEEQTEAEAHATAEAEELAHSRAKSR